MDKAGFFPKKNLVYDPFWSNGSVARHFEDVGFEKIVHRDENFQQICYPHRLLISPGQVPFLVSNPPWSAPVLGPFFKLLVKWIHIAPNAAFVLILSRFIDGEDYFGAFQNSIKSEGREFLSFKTPKGFSFKDPSGKTITNKGLRIACCFPPSWGVTRETISSKFKNAVNTTVLLGNPE